MTTLTEVLTNECVAMSHQEALAHVKAKTTTVDGIAQSGSVLAYIASINKLAAFRAVVADSNHPLQNAADAAIVTLETREGFDFSNAGTLALMSAFVAGGILTQVEADAVQAIGQKQKPEFNITLQEIIAIRDPSLTVTSNSNVETNKGANRTHDLELIVTGSVPADTYANILIRHSVSGAWRRVAGIAGITSADTYYQRLPSEFFKAGTEIKCQCAYALTMSLTAKAV